MLDPVLALVGFSEFAFMQFARIREPFVRYVAISGLGAEKIVVVKLTSDLAGNFSTNAH